MKNCNTCFNQINEKAYLCTHCKSYQNWRRHINLSSSVLALLIALFSVLGIVVPKFYTLMQGEFSQVEVKSYTITEKGISLLVSNQGNKPGYVSNCQIVIFDDLDKKEIWKFNLDITKPSTTKIVEEKSLDEKYYELKVHYFAKQIEQFSEKFGNRIDDENFKFKVEIKIGQYDGIEVNQVLGPSLVKDLYYNLRI